MPWGETAVHQLDELLANRPDLVVERLDVLDALWHSLDAMARLP